VASRRRLQATPDLLLGAKEWKEISNLKIKQSKMFKMLKELKTCNALQFAEGKYYSAPVCEGILD
jgi:hypothetical protein